MATTINADTSEGLKLTSDTSGELELQSAGVTKVKVTSSGLTDSSGNAYGLSKTNGMYRNLIINGDMRIAQRGTSASGLTNGSNGYHTVDRWKFSESGTPTFALTMSQDTDVPSGQGFSNSVKYDITTAQPSLGAGDSLAIAQYNEGQNLQHLKYGTANAETVTLSFWVKSNKTGTYIVELLANDGGTRLINKSYTIDSANTWEKKTITIEGDTSGTIFNNNGASLGLQFFLAAGSDYTSGTLQTSWGSYVAANRLVGQVNLADSTSNYINITGVQLEVGEGASDFEFLPYDVQLQRCQRYYWQGNRNSVIGRTFNTANVTLDVTSFSPVSLRATPSVTWSGGGTDWRGAGTSPTSSAATANIGIDGSGTTLRWTQDYSAGTLSANYQFHLAGSPTLYIEAEL